MRARMSGLALAAAVLATGPGAASWAATAATAWTVHPGGASTATAGTTKVGDSATTSVLNCRSSRMSGTLKSGTGLPGTGIGSITAAGYKCAILIYPPFRLLPRGLPWHLNLVAYDAGTGVSRGTISHVKFAFTGPACTAAINGTGGSTPDGVVAVSYASTTGTLTIHAAGGNLHWYHVSGCAGLVGDGHPATLAAAYAISPKQTITSP